MYHEIHTQSGKYNFAVHPADSVFHRLAGLYIFITISPLAEKHNSEVETPCPPWRTEARHSEQACTEQSRSIEGQYSLLYIGITNNFNSRLKQHHKIAAAMELGMTHIGILKISSARKRKKIEREILKYLNPPLNQTWLYDTSTS